MEFAFLLAFVLCREAVPFIPFVLLSYIVYSWLVTRRFWESEKAKAIARLVDDGVDVDEFYTLLSSRYASFRHTLALPYTLTSSTISSTRALITSYYDLLLSYYDYFLSYYDRIPTCHDLLSLYSASPWLIVVHWCKFLVLCVKAYVACIKLGFRLFCLYWRFCFALCRLPLLWVKAWVACIKFLFHLFCLYWKFWVALGRLPLLWAKACVACIKLFIKCFFALYWKTSLGVLNCLAASRAAAQACTFPAGFELYPDDIHLGDIASAFAIRVLRRIARPFNMEEKVDELLTVLKNGNLAIETKVNRLLSIKSDIKQKNVSVHIVAPLFTAVQLAISSSHSQIYAAGFSTLSHLLKRLYIQELPGEIASQARNLYPVLLERLGDHKERIRAYASQAFTDLWPAASSEVEKQVLGSALVGKNPRAKEASIAWLYNISKTVRILIKAYVPSLVACLEDADSAVREMAKTTVIELFRNAAAHAKLDLKREILERHVRKSIANAILSNIGLDSGPERPSSPGIFESDNIMSQHPVRPQSTAPIPPRPKSTVPTAPKSIKNAILSNTGLDSGRPSSPGIFESDNIMSQHPARPQSTAPIPPRPKSTVPTAPRPQSTVPAASKPRDGDSPNPLFVQSARELEDMFRGMAPAFEGRESEQNWGAREKNVNTIRRLAQGNAPLEFLDVYLASVKAVLDGIFKVVNSLRTTPSTNGLLLVQELAKVCGPKLDPMVEVMMQHLTALCAGTKKITREIGCEVVDTILGHVSYTSRFLNHVSGACEGKTPWIREYGARWLKTLLQRQGHNKSSLEHNGGLEIIDKCIKKGLNDATPGVREVMRGTFWLFNRIWPSKAEAIMSNLDKRSRQMLEKDTGNPNLDMTASQPVSPKKGLAKTSSRSALKEVIAAQKKAHLAPAKTLPPRPGSAQAVLTEDANGTNRGPTTVRSVPTGASTSSMSSAPVRPGARPRRPEVARPATAEPFSTSRRPLAAKPSGVRPRKLDLPKATQSDSTAVEPAVPAEQELDLPKAAKSDSTAVELVVPAEQELDLPKATQSDSTAVEPAVPAEQELDIPKAAKSDSTAVELVVLAEQELDLPKVTQSDSTAVEPAVEPAVPAEQELDLPKTATQSDSAAVEPAILADKLVAPEMSKNDQSLDDMPLGDRPRSPVFDVTADELALTGNRLPKIRRLTYQGELDDNDPLTRRWKQAAIMVKKRRDISSQSQSLPFARDLLNVAHTLIKSGHFDMWGYRKLQALIAFHDELFVDEKAYGNMLRDILEDLQRYPDHGDDAAKMRSVMDHKTQVLHTIRFMFVYHEEWFANHRGEVIGAILPTRQFFESRFWVVTALNETASDLIFACDLGDLVDSVMDSLNTMNHGDLTYRSMTMGVLFITRILTILNSQKVRIPDKIVTRVGEFAVDTMTRGHLDTRSHIGHLCQQVRDMAGSEEHFWDLLGAPDNQWIRNIFSYYFYKK
ncbi:suppressor of tub2 mutation [Aspergillus nanangensis]|uniref:Suppressor of tub2 mutation n=1 Tax=Aspergillus nanangensis TaxID=2582783 RepID=A0AAD4CC34_ASPNN|nr:suppressor of tub2 mutation [Aspergillus nanangensis]